MWLCELLIKGGQYFFDWVVTGEQRSPFQTQGASHTMTLGNNYFFTFRKFHSHSKAQCGVQVLSSLFVGYLVSLALILCYWIEFVSLLYPDDALASFWYKYLNCFNVFLSRAPRFKGYQQQDSQELLHYLMDSIRVEETKVRPWHMATWSLDSTNWSSFRFLWNLCWIFQVSAPHLLVSDEACRVPMIVVLCVLLILGCMYFMVLLTD